MYNVYVHQKLMLNRGTGFKVERSPRPILRHLLVLQASFLSQSPGNMGHRNLLGIRHKSLLQMVPPVSSVAKVAHIRLCHLSHSASKSASTRPLNVKFLFSVISCNDIGSFIRIRLPSTARCNCRQNSAK